VAKEAIVPENRKLRWNFQLLCAKRRNRLEWSVCSCLTQLILFDGRGVFTYLRYNYMFRLMTTAIFRLYMNP